MKRKIFTIFASLVGITLLKLVLQNCQTHSECAGCNGPTVELTVTPSTHPCSQCRWLTTRKGSENRQGSDHSYVLPDDDIIDKLNSSSLTIMYWRYINTIQFLCRNQTRVGKMRDGGKEICVDQKYKPRKPCLVYSFGSNYDFEFEKDMTERFGCEVHTFDPRLGLAEKEYRNIRLNWQMQRLSTIIAHLNHKNRTIDVLKIDIEGDEWTTLPEIFRSGELQRVRQLCMEIHFGRVIPNRLNHTTAWGNVTLETQLKVLRKLYSEGFRIFMREHNTFRIQYFEKPFREITNVNEISLVNLNLEYGPKEFDYRRIFGDKASKFDIFS